MRPSYRQPYPPPLVARTFTPGGAYALVTNWHVDPVTGDDTNDGSIASPVKTISQVLRRVGAFFTPPQEVTINYHGTSCTEDVVWSLGLLAFDLVVKFDVVIQTLPVGAGTATYLRPSNPISGAQPPIDTATITDPAMNAGRWAQFVGRPYILRITSGPATGQCSLLREDLGTGTVRTNYVTGPLVSSISDLSGSEVQPVNGVPFTYEIFKCPQITGTFLFLGGQTLGPPRNPPLNIIGATIGFLKFVNGDFSLMVAPEWVVFDRCWFQIYEPSGGRACYLNACGIQGVFAIVGGQYVIALNLLLLDSFVFVNRAGRFESDGTPVIQNPSAFYMEGKFQIHELLALANMAAPITIYGGGTFHAGNAVLGLGSTSHHWECDSNSGVEFPAGCGFACGTTAPAQIKLRDGAGNLRATVPVINVSTLAQVGVPLAVTYANLIAANPGGFGGSARDTLSGAYAVTNATTW